MKLRVETSQAIGRPVEQVFEAWVDPGKMTGYFISGSSGRMEAGRTVSWTWDDHGGMQLDIDVKTVENAVECGDRLLIPRFDECGPSGTRWNE